MQESVLPFFNGLRETERYTPQFVMKSLNELVEDRKYYAQCFRSHLKVLDSFGLEVVKLRKDVKKFNTILSQKKLHEKKLHDY